MNFAEYAKDHSKHPHCAACYGCLLDPKFSPENNVFFPLWCAGCMCRLKKTMPEGTKPLWMTEFVKCE